MADWRPHALDDDSFPVELFPGKSDRHTTAPASEGIGAAGVDPDLLLPGADELFPQSTETADDSASPPPQPTPPPVVPPTALQPPVTIQPPVPPVETPRQLPPQEPAPPAFVRPTP